MEDLPTASHSVHARWFDPPAALSYREGELEPADRAQLHSRGLRRYDNSKISRRAYMRAERSMGPMSSAAY